MRESSNLCHLLLLYSVRYMIDSSELRRPLTLQQSAGWEFCRVHLGFETQGDPASKLGSWGHDVLRHDCPCLMLQFCADVPPGNARAKECLEDNREAPGFSATCKTEVEKMMESRASDFRLDPKLRQLCADDIQVTDSSPAWSPSHCSCIRGAPDPSTDAHLVEI